MRLLQNCLIPLANTRLIALLGVLFIHGNTLTATAYQDSYPDDYDYYYYYYNDPTYNDPTYNDPTYNDPSYNDPTYNDPTYNDPTYNDPSYNDPSYNDPAYEDPAYEDDTYISEEPPYASDDWIMTTYNQSIYFDPLENDYSISAPIDPSSITIVTPPAFGSVQFDSESGYMEYTPNPDVIGLDMFEYTVSDTNGNVSNIASVWVDVFNTPPMMLEFTVREGVADMWHFEGRISDEDPGNVTIHFGGLLEGETVSVNPDGTFKFNKLILDGIGGGVSAQAVDQFGEESEILYDEVYFF